MSKKYPYMTDKAELGDIITAPEFAYCTCESDIVWSEKDQRYVPQLHPKELTVEGYQQKNHPVGFRAYTDRKGNAVNDKFDKGCFEQERGLAEFVVETTKMDGGGEGQGTGDYYPDGWHVTARRLNKDGTYNPDGETVKFYQSRGFSCNVDKVKVVGKMKMLFQRIEGD